jgi:hypothetical protein
MNLNKINVNTVEFDCRDNKIKDDEYYLILDKYSIEPNVFTSVNSFDDLTEVYPTKDVYLVRNFVDNDMSYINNPYTIENSKFEKAQIFINSYIMKGNIVKKFAEIKNENKDKSYIYILRKTFEYYKNKIDYGYIKELGYSSMPYKEINE